ncbi:MAG: hypothetical protein R3F11_24895 [Verrucomicrobiales bacterium]
MRGDCKQNWVIPTPGQVPAAPPVNLLPKPSVDAPPAAPPIIARTMSAPTIDVRYVANLARLT